jgi:hypothetical protein
MNVILPVGTKGVKLKSTHRTGTATNPKGANIHFTRFHLSVSLILSLTELPGDASHNKYASTFSSRMVFI